MPKCGCAGSTCGCKVSGSGGISVTGTGTAQDPYVVTLGAINIGALVTVDDSTSVDLTKSGAGTALDPIVITASVKVGATVTSVPTTGGTTAIDADTRVQYLDHGATIATQTITLPAASNALEKEIKIISRSIVTTLTVNGAGGTTVVGMPATLAANGYFRAQLFGTVWRRVG